MPNNEINKNKFLSLSSLIQRFDSRPVKIFIIAILGISSLLWGPFYLIAKAVGMGTRIFAKRSNQEQTVAHSAEDEDSNQPDGPEDNTEGPPKEKTPKIVQALEDPKKHYTPLELLSMINVDSIIANYYAIPLPGEKPKDNIVARSIHGGLHIARVTINSAVLASILGFSRAEVIASIYAAAYHDSGRKGEEADIWEKESAINCGNAMLENRIDKEIVKITMEAILNKDVGTQIPKQHDNTPLEKRYTEHTSVVIDVTGKIGLSSAAIIPNDYKKGNVEKLLAAVDCMDMERARDQIDVQYLTMYQDFKKGLKDTQYYQQLCKIEELRGTLQKAYSNFRMYRNTPKKIPEVVGNIESLQNGLRMQYESVYDEIKSHARNGENKEIVERALQLFKLSEILDINIYIINMVTMDKWGGMENNMKETMFNFENPDPKHRGKGCCENMLKVYRKYRLYQDELFNTQLYTGISPKDSSSQTQPLQPSL